MDTELSTGLPGLDKILNGLMVGDNVVWQIESIEDYRRFVLPYAEAAKKSGKPLVYFRFADHPPLLPDDFEAERHTFSPHDGFESFIADIHKVIERAGHGAFYIFDCLSSLAVDWYSDQMLGNFFVLTCPYLYDLETIAYFALYRNRHTTQALDPISSTTQVFLDVYRHQDDLYVRPVKIQHRHSPTIHMFHLWQADQFKPVSSSVIISEITSSTSFSPLRTQQPPGIWEPGRQQPGEIPSPHRSDSAVHPDLPMDRRQELFDRLVRMSLSRDERMLALVSRHLSLEDILDIQRHMIGTGLIGGKAIGMLVGRAILAKSDQRLADLLETHDSFFVGSDVFYTFLVRNGVWWIRQKQRSPETFLDGAEEARRRILTGTFPDYIMRQFEDLLDYFGQYPFIIRSSSLLEDNFSNSFPGKYESVFCVNQGPRERRLENFIAGVRTVYAGCMSEKALRYREQRGLLDKDEQMSLLIMRVSGALHNRDYYPQVAGVGFSFNPYVWNEDIDPEAGVIRLVFGLGTRAVDRADDDYTRVVALNAPNRRPESNFDEVREYSQRRVDHLCFDTNRHSSSYFNELIADVDDLPFDLFVSSADGDDDAAGKSSWVLTFNKLLAETTFVKDMRLILKTLRDAYQHPVDIEFAANFKSVDSYKLNLLQCRPLHVMGSGSVSFPAIKIRKEDLLLETHGGAVIGQSRIITIDRLIYVVPELYGQLPIRSRHEVARIIGRINARCAGNVMLLGPGRWGTASPSLGIPVTFAEISNIAILCEIVAMHENLIPDASLGTHFLNELVEMNMLYLAFYPRQGQNYLNHAFFQNSPNKLSTLVPGMEKQWEQLINVIDPVDVLPAGKKITLAADAMGQKVFFYISRE